MRSQPKFENENTSRLWDDYFYRVGKIIRYLDKQQQNDLIVDLKSHVYDIFKNSEQEDEVSGLLDAFDKMGKPEEYLKPIISEKLVTGVLNTMNPISFLLGIAHFPITFIKRGIITIVVGTVLSTTFLLSLIAMSKVFLNESVGFFVYEKGGWFLGVDYNPPDGTTEVLGYWIIPIGLTLYFGVNYTISRLIRLLLRNRK